MLPTILPTSPVWRLYDHYFHHSVSVSFPRGWILYSINQLPDRDKAWWNLFGNEGESNVPAIYVLHNTYGTVSRFPSCSISLQIWTTDCRNEDRSQSRFNKNWYLGDTKTNCRTPNQIKNSFGEREILFCWRWHSHFLQVNRGGGNLVQLPEFFETGLNECADVFT